MILKIFDLKKGNRDLVVSYKHSGNYFVIVETIFFIQNFEFIEKITQKFH